LKRHALEFILVMKFGWSKLSIWGDQLWNPITTKHHLILSYKKISHGSIRCILQLSCLQIWILFTQEYVMAFWMKTITKSTWFCCGFVGHCESSQFSLLRALQTLSRLFICFRGLEASKPRLDTILWTIHC
jgi:hypothetical protein